MALDFQNPKSLYLQIVDNIKSKISSEQLKVGDKLDSHHELSHLYNVSLITVKKSFNRVN